MCIEKYLLDNKIKSYVITKSDIGHIINEIYGPVLAIDVGRTIKFVKGKLVFQRNKTYKTAKYKMNNQNEAQNQVEEVTAILADIKNRFPHIRFNIEDEIDGYYLSVYYEKLNAKHGYETLASKVIKWG